MKQHYKLPNAQSLFQGIKRTILYSCVTFILYGCFLKQDRTTTVYGTIIDEHQQPVDSILIMVQGLRYLTFETLNEVYTDEKGNYEVVTEVPKKFGSINVTVPFLLKENPKYQRNYKGKKSFKDGTATNNCCTASVGEKTKYDFQLIPK